MTQKDDTFEKKERSSNTWPEQQADNANTFSFSRFVGFGWTRGTVNVIE